jgi:hypothetical protein
MHVRPVRSRILCILALLAVCTTCATAAASSSPLKLGGRWSGSYNGAFSGTFKLTWKETGPRLTGSITLSNPKGTYDISGSVHGKAITFGAVGVGATYTGPATSTKMSGRYKSPQGGGGWSAYKCKSRTVC